MRKLLTTIAFVLATTSAANADFLSWSYVVEKDPFKKTEKVTASYLDTLESGMFVICDQNSEGLEIRILAGWEATPNILNTEVETALAVDGRVLIESMVGIGTAFGENVAGVIAVVTADKATTFIDAMMNAKRQIAFRDGISLDPLLLGAEGSTAAGKALKACLDKQQPGGGNQP